MDWHVAEGPLIATRAMHFAATSIVAGTLLFRTVVAGPVLRSEALVADVFRTQMRRVVWIGLLAAAISGAIWLLLQAASMSGVSPSDTSVLPTILQETQFGQIAEIRAATAILLAASLALDRFAGANWAATATALGLAASLAWAGHAGATDGQAGNAHVAADALHLCAAAAWIGGLLGLVIFFVVARRTPGRGWTTLVRKVTERFSILGIVSVAILSLSGVVNALVLVGSSHALIGTAYGRLLLLKLVFFAAMLMLAATNRFWLTPRLSSSSDGVLRWLLRSSVIEFASGLAVLTIVGMLGTLHPAVHLTGQ